MAEPPAQIALTLLLFAVRELAARASAEELTSSIMGAGTVPMAESDLGRFLVLLRRRLREFARIPTLPIAARALLTGLIDFDHTKGKAALRFPKDFSARTKHAIHEGWQDVLARSMADAALDRSVREGRSFPSTGLCPLLALVNGGEQPRNPESIRQDLRLPLRARSSKLLPVPPQTENAGTYRGLWCGFLAAASNLPEVHDAGGFDAWLEALDSLLAAFLHSVPLDPYEETPIETLLDAVRIAASCGIARYYHGSEVGASEAGNDPYLFVLGEFHPIQQFILGTDPNTRCPPSAALGGRSAFVKLSAELAVLAILERFGLPQVCAIMAAASKFLLLLPNTRRTRKLIHEQRLIFEKWSLDELGANATIVLGWWMGGAAAVSAVNGGGIDRFGARYERAVRRLEENKFRKFRLLEGRDPILQDLYERILAAPALCDLDGHLPAEVPRFEAANETRPSTVKLARASAFQLMLAARLGMAKDLIVSPSQESDGDQEFSLFGYQVALADDVARRDLAPRARVWDISGGKFNGRRMLPMSHFGGEYEADQLAVLKGDVDRLGRVFKLGIPGFRLSRLASISRQFDVFFDLKIGALLQDEFEQVQAVLASGDDFMFVGRPGDIIDFAERLHVAWREYTGNDSLTFSAGIAVRRGRSQVRQLVNDAEDALVEAKRTRNSVHVHGRTVSWATYLELLGVQREIMMALAEHARFFEASRPAAYEAIRQLQRAMFLDLQKIAQRMDDSRSFSAWRWRANVQSRLRTYCNDLVLLERELSAMAVGYFDALDNLFDARGFSLHRKDMAVVLGNLLIQDRRASSVEVHGGRRQYGIR